MFLMAEQDDPVYAIEFTAEIIRLQTMTDGGIRLTLDLPENAIAEMAMLAECRVQGLPMKFSATVSDQRLPRLNAQQRRNRSVQHGK